MAKNKTVWYKVVYKNRPTYWNSCWSTEQLAWESIYQRGHLTEKEIAEAKEKGWSVVKLEK